MKPGTFTQMYVQLVFAVKNRNAALSKDIRPRVFEYMSGILTNQKHKSIIINGISNHIHILFGLNPTISVSDTVYEIKRSTSLFINRENFVLKNSPGKKVMEDLHIVVLKSQIFTIILKIRNHITK